MASFTDALQALAQGRLKADVLLAHLEHTLTCRPDLLDAVLAQLAEAYGSGLIEAPTSAKLKAHALRAAQAASRAAGEGRRPAAAERGNGPRTSAATVPRSAITEAAAQRADLDAAAMQVDVGDLDLNLAEPAASPDDELLAESFRTIELPSQPIGVGSIIKERFVLDEIIGVGGMGTVYKGRDLLKVEACDRNPYVALKVLNENFKKHPDAFIALQREASRQQKLAHPNIATVYDFDRSGNTIFLTMEYLEGQGLNTFLRKEVRPRGGLPFAEALPIIRGLAQALSYAHERDIVHSDFKPANCFLSATGTVKVLDFGIARVMKRSDDAENTVFNPSSLGALTPAYASAEMLEGEEPDPRDDVYALACVAYELLSGRHPFDRKSASYARDRRMTPAPIRGLSRAQMRALTRALAFSRRARTASVAAFIEELQSTPPRMRTWWWIALALVTFVGLAVALHVTRPAASTAAPHIDRPTLPSS